MKNEKQLIKNINQYKMPFMNRQIIKISVGILCFGIFLLSIDANAQKKNIKQYDIAAIVWPSYHPDPRAKIF